MYKYVHHSVFIDLKLTMVYKTTATNRKLLVQPYKQIKELTLQILASQTKTLFQ